LAAYGYANTDARTDDVHCVAARKLAFFAAGLPLWTRPARVRKSCWRTELTKHRPVGYGVCRIICHSPNKTMNTATNANKAAAMVFQTGDFWGMTNHPHWGTENTPAEQ
jgi:hypothetical protein